MNTIPGPAVVIFDLDGTLVDSAPDLATSVSHALDLVGVAAPSVAKIRQYIGNGAERLIHRSLTGDMQGVADEDLFGAARDSFFAHYANNLCRDSKLYPGVRDTLETLGKAGYGIACVTNKPERFTLPLLKLLQIDNYFSIAIGGDTLASKKPSPVPLQHVATHCGVAVEQCAMIGDTLTDVLAARNANMPVIFVSYGYGQLDDVHAHRPEAITDYISDIPTILTNELSPLSCGAGKRP